MDEAAGQHGRARRIVLPIVFDGVAATELRDQLLGLIEGGHPFFIDAGQVERASTHGVQVLLAAAKSLRSIGGRLEMASPAPVLGAAFADLGLAATFTQWQQTSGTGAAAEQVA